MTKASLLPWITPAYSFILSSNTSRSDSSKVPSLSTLLRWKRKRLYCCIAARYSRSICDSTELTNRRLSSPLSLTREVSDGETITIGSTPMCSEIFEYALSSLRTFFSPLPSTCTENRASGPIFIEYVPETANVSVPCRKLNLSDEANALLVIERYQTASIRFVFPSPLLPEMQLMLGEKDNS